MLRLKQVISEYNHWDSVSIYVNRIESHIKIDFSFALENAKALLETIGKEICAKNGKVLADNSSINGVVKNAFSSMGYSNTQMVNKISSALATIAQQVGDLRNEIGSTSHGKTLEEIKKRNQKVDLLTREFLMETIESVAVFLIRTFETKQVAVIPPSKEQTLDYWEAEEFNESWDDSFGDFTMGEYSYPASEVLFNVDKKAYVSEYTAFVDNENMQP